MANTEVIGSGKYSVIVNWSDGGKTTHKFQDKKTRDQAFSRYKQEVAGTTGKVRKSG